MTVSSTARPQRSAGRREDRKQPHLRRHFITNADMTVWTLHERLNTRPALEPTGRHAHPPATDFRSFSLRKVGSNLTRPVLGRRSAVCLRGRGG